MNRFINISSSQLFSAVIAIALSMAVLFACEQFEPERIVKVETGSIESLDATSCTAQGLILDTGEDGIDQHGFCWSEAGNPSIEDNRNDLGPKGTKGSFSGDLNGLSASTTYYLRAYARTNSLGTSYGSEVSFKTSNLTGTVTDYDGNIYSTVKIGNQWWMAKNLKVTHYSDGTVIPLVEDDSAWDALGSLDEAYCYYDNSSSNGNIYGAIYTWAAAMNGAGSSDANPSGVQGVCPDGWHLPSDDEWKELEMYLGMSQTEADAIEFRGADQGSQLAGRSSLWTDNFALENDPAFGSSGFMALPGGYKLLGHNFEGLGYEASFWSATENSGAGVYARGINYTRTDVNRDEFLKNNGFSVRCVKDEETE